MYFNVTGFLADFYQPLDVESRTYLFYHTSLFFLHIDNVVGVQKKTVYKAQKYMTVINL